MKFLGDVRDETKLDFRCGLRISTVRHLSSNRLVV